MSIKLATTVGHIFYMTLTTFLWLDHLVSVFSMLSDPISSVFYVNRFSPRHLHTLDFIFDPVCSNLKKNKFQTECTKERPSIFILGMTSHTKLRSETEKTVEK